MHQFRILAGTGIEVDYFLRGWLISEHIDKTLPFEITRSIQPDKIVHRLTLRFASANKSVLQAFCEHTQNKLAFEKILRPCQSFLGSSLQKFYVGIEGKDILKAYFILKEDPGLISFYSRLVSTSLNHSLFGILMGVSFTIKDDRILAFKVYEKSRKIDKQFTRFLFATSYDSLNRKVSTNIHINHLCQPEKARGFLSKTGKDVGTFPPEAMVKGFSVGSTGKINIYFFDSVFGYGRF